MEEVAEVAAVFFGGSADFALAFAGIEAGGLELESFDLFGGGDIDVVINHLGVLEAMVEECGDFDAPAFEFCLYFIFIADADGFGGFSAISIVFDLSFVAGFGGLGAGFEQANGPEIFIETEFFFFGHDWAVELFLCF